MQVSKGTKQLVSDLRVLRKLLFSLLSLDCVSFQLLCEAAKRESDDRAMPSAWLLSDAADKLFRYAKARVYAVRNAPATSKYFGSSTAAANLGSTI